MTTQLQLINIIIIIIIIIILCDHVEKYCTAGQATDANMAHAHCMLDT
jgi:hypothetical protein